VRHAIPDREIVEFCALRGLDVCLGWQAIRRAQATITLVRLASRYDRFTARSSVRTDNDRLTAAHRTPAETPPKRREVGKNTAHLLHLVPAIKGKVRRDTIITVRVSPAAN
jgi:hypothetical protein